MPPLNLGKMVGPLPVGGWLGVVGAGLGLGFLVRKMGPRGADSDGEIAASEPVTKAIFLPAAVGGGSEPRESPTSNIEWQRNCGNRLIAMGYESYKVQQALTNYLDGISSIDDDERAIADLALRTCGMPPLPPMKKPAPLPKESPPPAPPAPVVPKPTPVKGPIRMYWQANAVYMTNSHCRTQWGLTPTQVDYWKGMEIPLSGKPGDVNAQPGHDSMKTVAGIKQVMDGCV